MDIYNELNQKSLSLDKMIEQLRENGKIYAEAERDYKIKLRQEALKLRDSGMAIGMIDKVVYGIEEVADLRRDRDAAEVMYKASIESINTQKLQIRLLENQIERDWSQSRRN